MKPLDFVKVNGHIGIIIEVSKSQNIHKACIQWLEKDTGLHNAWWGVTQFKVINNLPNILSQSLCHSFSGNSLQPFEEN